MITPRDATTHGDRDSPPAGGVGAAVMVDTTANSARPGMVLTKLGTPVSGSAAIYTPPEAVKPATTFPVALVHWAIAHGGSGAGSCAGPARSDSAPPSTDK